MSESATPMVVVISGPSGVGKSTIVGALSGRHPELAPVVAVTTRPRRPEEVDGVHYHFLSLEAFAALRDAGELLEWAEVHGHWYGTPREQVARALAAGRHAVLPIDPQGARSIRNLVPDALLIFVMPPSMDDLLARLRSRRSESQASLALRERSAATEIAASTDYDHVVVNETGQAGEAADRIWQIIDREARREPPRRARI